MPYITHESVMYTKFDFQFAYKTFTHIVFIRVHEIFIFCKDGDDPKLFPSFAVTSQASQQQSRQKTCNQNVSKAHGEALGWRRIFLFRLQNLVGMLSQG